MFGNTNRFWRDAHQEAQRNMPWRYSGDLDAQAIARFDAHLATCAECRADLRIDAKLRALPQSELSPDSGWAHMSQRLTPRPVRIAPAGPPAMTQPRWQAWAIAAQFLVIVGLSAALLMPRAQTAQFHALSAAVDVEAGNLLVMFGPQVSELSMRRILQDTGARVVDGPNAAGAYVLRVPSERRVPALTALQARPEIILAQPVDSGGAP